MDNIESRASSQAVQAHLGILQGVIQRMASNSASCKGWCITLVAALLVVVADKGKPQMALIALIPTLLFLALDAYYLALEKAFRKSYNHFIEKLHSAQLQASDLYVVEPEGAVTRLAFSALLSFSIWPFYGTLLVMVCLARVYVIP